MNTTNSYLDAVKARHHLASDYAIAKKLGISTSSISNYRAGRSHMDETVAIKVAESLQIDPAKVVLDARLEQEKRPEVRAVWMDIFQKLGGVAAASLLALGLTAAPTPADAKTASNSDTICIMLSRKRKKKASPFSLIGQLSAAH